MVRLDTHFQKIDVQVTAQPAQKHDGWNRRDKRHHRPAICLQPAGERVTHIEKPMLRDYVHPVNRRLRRPRHIFRRKNRAINKHDGGDQQRHKKAVDDACQHAQKKSRAVGFWPTPDLEQKCQHKLCAYAAAARPARADCRRAADFLRPRRINFCTRRCTAIKNAARFRLPHRRQRGRAHPPHASERFRLGRRNRRRADEGVTDGTDKIRGIIRAKVFAMRGKGHAAHRNFASQKASQPAAVAFVTRTK